MAFMLPSLITPTSTLDFVYICHLLLNIRPSDAITLETTSPNVTMLCLFEEQFLSAVYLAIVCKQTEMTGNNWNKKTYIPSVYL